MAGALFLPHDRLADFLHRLSEAGYSCVGPQLRDGAVVYDDLSDPGRLPWGLRDRQAPGHYRIEAGETNRAFAWANGPQALKPLLFAPHERLWRMRRADDGGLAFEACAPPAGPTAVIGVRPCDIAAQALQDRHFLDGEVPDPHYGVRRDGLFLVAVNCSHPAATCFCASTGDGPVAGDGYDLLLDETDEGFLIEAGSRRGDAVLEPLALAPPDAAARAAVALQRQRAAEQQRRLPGRNLREALFANLDHPRWEAVAERCLACANCTAVCPTCFCHRHEDDATLDSNESVHARVWDSCFTEGHSYIHGIVIRASTAYRYRQWLTHKLGSWHEQFGRSGCVGCGRCIAWCPAGIDITEEAAAICGEGE